MDESQLTELERIRGWACCLEPERRYLAEIKADNLKVENEVLKTFIGHVRKNDYWEEWCKVLDALSQVDDG